MTAKELRAAAEQYRRTAFGDEPLRELADYILSTVREDDDEPALVGYEIEGAGWIKADSCDSWSVRVEADECGRIMTLSGWEIKQNPTRGQVRRLAAALGIELADTRGTAAGGEA